jgi:molybdate transport system substrate-binding protein
MSRRIRPRAEIVYAVAALLAAPSAAPAQLQVIISAGFFPVYQELLPGFEQASGLTVTTGRGGSIGMSPNAIPNQIRRGVPADVVILAREGLNELIEEGRIVAGTDVDLARSVIGMVVPAGAPTPDIGTVAALRETLLRARSVAVSTSTSGTYLTSQLFPQLGIADEMAPKTLTTGAAAVGRGEAEIGLQQVSEVITIPNTEFVGPLPSEVQYVTTYAAGVVWGSTRVEAARQLIALLSSEDADPTLLKSGLEPAGSR